MNGQWIRTQDGAIGQFVFVTEPQLDEETEMWALIGDTASDVDIVIAEYPTEDQAWRALENLETWIDQVAMGYANSVFYHMPAAEEELIETKVEDDAA